MEIVIERATSADAKEILEYLKQAGAETDNLTFGGEGLPYTPEEEAQHIKEAENSHNEVMLLAKADGKIIGDAGLSRMSRRMSHRGNLGLAVKKEYWNCGVGSRLISEAIKFAKENQIEIIDLEVRCDNTAAIHLYEKFGFKRIGTHPAFFKLDGNEIPFDYMYLKVE